MKTITSVCSNVSLGSDGIWYGAGHQHVSYPEHGNDTCFSIEEESFWFMHRNECICELVRRFPPAAGEAIFDIGGGNGYVSRGLIAAGHDAVLIEPGNSGARNAMHRGVKNVVCATTVSAGVMPATLGAIGLFDVIEHMEDDIGFLREMRRLSKPGGMLYATVPAYSFLWSGEDVIAGHFRRYTAKGIAAVLAKAGFSVEYDSYFFRALPLPIFLLRSLPFRLGISALVSDSSGAKEHHQKGRGGLAAHFLVKSLEGEREKIARGVRMGFGASCIIAARAV